VVGRTVAPVSSAGPSFKSSSVPWTWRTPEGALPAGGVAPAVAPAGLVPAGRPAAGLPALAGGVPGLASPPAGVPAGLLPAGFVPAGLVPDGLAGAGLAAPARGCWAETGVGPKRDRAQPQATATSATRRKSSMTGGFPSWSLGRKRCGNLTHGGESLPDRFPRAARLFVAKLAPRHSPGPPTSPSLTPQEPSGLPESSHAALRATQFPRRESLTTSAAPHSTNHTPHTLAAHLQRVAGESGVWSRAICGPAPRRGSGLGTWSIAPLRTSSSASAGRLSLR